MTTVGQVCGSEEPVSHLVCLRHPGHMGPHSWEEGARLEMAYSDAPIIGARDTCGVCSTATTKGYLICSLARHHTGPHSWQLEHPGAFPDVADPRHSVTMAALVEHVASKVAQRVEARLTPLLEQLLRERDR